LGIDYGLIAVSEIVYQAPKISSKEYRKCKGRHVGLYKGKIIADGSGSVEALERALKKYLKLRPDQVALFYIQGADVLVL
jgi:dihydroxyacetone kinase-like predicted kinase